MLLGTKLSTVTAGLLLSSALHAFTPLGTPDIDDIEYPDDEPPSAGQVELGKKLYFDPRLSHDNRQSCATCHSPELGFSDGLEKSIGAMGGKVGRNAPHIYNLAWNTTFFWDGRASTLEEQALGPIEAEGEMNMPLDELIPKLQNIGYYQTAFNQHYGADGITKDNIAHAIASFERSIISNNSAFDRYIAGDKFAMSPSSVRGMALFKDKANCIQCHDGPNFTDESFHNIGVKGDDLGRAGLAGFENDKSLQGAFKTPGLRNIVLSSPYMHDGSEKTLEDVVEFYNRGGDQKKGLDKQIKPLSLTKQEVADLVAFLGALTDPVMVSRPELP